MISIHVLGKLLNLMLLGDNGLTMKTFEQKMLGLVQVLLLVVRNILYQLLCIHMHVIMQFMKEVPLMYNYYLSPNSLGVDQLRYYRIVTQCMSLLNNH